MPDTTRVGKNTVVIKRLRTCHEQQDFRRYLPLGQAMVQEIAQQVAAIFDLLGGKDLIKPSGDVYLKPNAVEAKPYTHTRPEVVAAAIRYWLKAGARNVFLMENSTQATYTRLVFELTGYNRICKETGATPLYLDEEDTATFPFTGKQAAGTDNPLGYELTSFRMPRTVADRLVAQGDKNLYVSLPKLKTHSMAGVTLGIKNQWAFPSHADRGRDHNYNLHSKLVDVLNCVRPDVTLVEGVEGTIYGHFPPLALANECVKPFRVLLGGLNVVAVDLAGARVLGKSRDDVPHLRIAVERGLGEGVESDRDIRVAGDLSTLENLDLLGDLADYHGSYPHDLYPDFPADIRVVQGKERACKEGCVNNSLAAMQGFYLDHQGKGGWTLLVGKGFESADLDSITGPVLVAGPCACREAGDRLLGRLGKKKVYFSRECNDLRSLVESMCHLMRINPLKLAPHNPVKVLTQIARARLHHSHGKLVHPASHLIKFH